MVSKKKQKSMIYDHRISCYFLCFKNRRIFWFYFFENISNQHINHGWRRNLGEIDMGQATFLTLENQLL